MLSSVGDTGVTSGLVASRPLVGWDGETYLRETFSVHFQGGRNIDAAGRTRRTKEVQAGHARLSSLRRGRGSAGVLGGVLFSVFSGFCDAKTL